MAAADPADGRVGRATRTCLCGSGRVVEVAGLEVDPEGEGEEVQKGEEEELRSEEAAELSSVVVVMGDRRLAEVVGRLAEMLGI